MNTRLTINLRDGLLEVEGGEDFVRSIYEDFKDQVSKTAALKAVQPKSFEQIEQPPAVRSIVEVRSPKKLRRSKSTDGTKTKTSEYKPTFKHHNFAGLAEFYNRFAPINNNEKILCFAVFLRDKLNIAPCHADDIYSCFFTLKAHTKTPTAFQQAFITAKNRTHYIEIDWPALVEITITGDNFFNEKLNKTGAPK